MELNTEITITNILGQIINKTKVISDKTEIGIIDQPKGMYFVNVYSREKIISHKIMVE